MELAPIVSRLMLLDDFAGRVFTATDAQLAAEYAATRTPVGAPSCIVYAPRESAEPSNIIGGVRHRTTVIFGVMSCVRYAGNAVAAYEQLDALRQTVISHLLGWVPTDDYRALQFVSGKLIGAAVDLAVDLVIWLDEYRTEYYLEA